MGEGKKGCRQGAMGTAANNEGTVQRPGDRKALIIQLVLKQRIKIGSISSVEKCCHTVTRKEI